MIGSLVGLQRVVLALAALLLSLTFFALAEPDLISRTYTWDYAGRTWSLEYDFPSYAYHLQASLTRTLDYTSYGVYVNDPRDDVILGDFVSQLEKIAVGLNIWQRLNLVVALVQSIPYVGESCEYPRYPLEMLVESQGDCEDAAILTAALVQHMGFDVVLLAFLAEHHMAVGIHVLPPQHETLQAYEWSGDLYFYLEPTSPGWEIGQRPAMYQSQPAIIGLPLTIASTSR
ncbi:MAG: hypothetical protein E4H08_06910 [Candidatus Atribacteria bacterium]|nr:MAG: hypothetical protein E4H08_06910 [Candidatus Atribacteria bacterium]